MAKKRNPLKVDPSRTITLRRMFTAELLRRFDRVRHKIIKLIVEENAFGLDTTNNQIRNEDNEDIMGSDKKAKVGLLLVWGVDGLDTNGLSQKVENQRFKFRSTAKQVEAFQKWLATQIKVDIISKQMTDKYWEKFVEDGYRRGAGRAFDDVRKASLATEAGAGVSDFFAGTRAEFLRSSFGRPVAINKVKLLAARTFSDIKNVTDVMATQIRRELVDGLVKGDNPRTIARAITKKVDTIGKTRAEQIARTEIIRAHAEGQLDSMEALGVEEVNVMVEWSTAGDDRVCPRCIDMDGAVLQVKESHGLIPRHVLCRCAFIPANLGESPKGQIRGKPKIDKAIDDSLRHDLPKGRLIKGKRKFKDPKTGKFTVSPSEGKKSLADLKKTTKWQGADVKIAKARPPGLLDDPLKPTKPVAPGLKPKPVEPKPTKPVKVKPTAPKRPRAKLEPVVEIRPDTIKKGLGEKIPTKKPVKVQKKKAEKPSLLKERTDTSRLNAEQKRAVSEIKGKLTGDMSPKVQKILEETNIVLYEKQEDLAKEMVSVWGGKVSDRKATQGFFRRSKNQVHVNLGGLKQGIKSQIESKTSLLAHELSHAIDAKGGVKGPLSNLKSWKKVWKKEIEQTGILSKYAQVNPAEGFAEFGRGLLGSNEATKKLLRENLPESYKFWKSKGLIK